MTSSITAPPVASSAILLARSLSLALIRFARAELSSFSSSGSSTSAQVGSAAYPSHFRSFSASRFFRQPVCVFQNKKLVSPVLSKKARCAAAL
jgi:hypothetical protein